MVISLKQLFDVSEGRVSIYKRTGNSPNDDIKTSIVDDNHVRKTDSFSVQRFDSTDVDKLSIGVCGGVWMGLLCGEVEEEVGVVVDLVFKACIVVYRLQVSFEYLLDSFFSAFDKLLIQFVFDFLFSEFLVEGVSGRCSLELEDLNPVFHHREVLFLYFEMSIVAPYVGFFPPIGVFEPVPILEQWFGIV